MSRYLHALLSVVIAFSLFSCSKSDLTSSPAAPPDTIPAVSKKWIISTLAGSGEAKVTDGMGISASFINPEKITVDTAGNVYVTDCVMEITTIRKITPEGKVTTYIGSNINTPDLPFGHFYGLAADKQGNIFTIDYSLIRKITSGTNSPVFAGSLAIGFKDDTGTSALFNLIDDIAIDQHDNLFLPDYDMDNTFKIRKVTPSGTVTTLSLEDNTGFPYTEGPNSWHTYSIAVDSSENIYVTANGGSMIKKIDSDGIMTVLAGAGNLAFTDGTGSDAHFYNISGIASDATGTLFVADYGNNAVRKVTPDGTVTTIAGVAGAGYADGDGAKAQLLHPTGVAVDKNGVVYVVDNGNRRIRKLEYK